MISISLIPIKSDGRFVGNFRGLLSASSDVYYSSTVSMLTSEEVDTVVVKSVLCRGSLWLRTITVTSERCRCAV